jgi:RNA polymerase sigma-70 factor (sigma-E family)
MDTVTRSADAPTFEEYAGSAWPSLYRYAYLLAGNHADAEDIAQQTLEKAYRSWSRVEKSDSPAAYLRRIVTNTYLSQRRPKARRLELLMDAPPETQQIPGGGPEERMALWPHVKSLPPRQRAVVVLRYYEDLSEQEIADVLGCSRGNVKSTAHHALKSLRAALATSGADASDGREN